MSKKSSHEINFDGKPIGMDANNYDRVVISCPPDFGPPFEEGSIKLLDEATQSQIREYEGMLLKLVPNEKSGQEIHAWNKHKKAWTLLPDNSGIDALDFVGNPFATVKDMKHQGISEGGYQTALKAEETIKKHWEKVSSTQLQLCGFAPKELRDFYKEEK